METVPAWLSQRPVADTDNQIELIAKQNTTISLWTMLVPLGTTLSSSSSVEEGGVLYAVVGHPADRPDHRPLFRAASLRLVSDMQ